MFLFVLNYIFIYSGGGYVFSRLILRRTSFRQLNEMTAPTHKAEIKTSGILTFQSINSAKYLDVRETDASISGHL